MESDHGVQQHCSDENPFNSAESSSSPAELEHYRLLAQRLEAERDRAQTALQQERHFMTAILDTIDNLVIVLNPNGQIVQFNRACEAAMAYTIDEVRGQCFWDLFLLPSEVEPVKAIFRQLQTGQFPNHYENHWLSKDGQCRLIAWSNTAILRDDGTVEYIIGTGIDVTEQRRSEQALQRSQQQQYQALIDSVDGIVWEIDRQTGQFTFVSQKAEQILGYPLERWFAEPDFWKMHTHPDDQHVVTALGTPLALEQQTDELEYRMVAAGGQVIWFKAVATAIAEDGQPAKLRGIMIDITARKKAEQANLLLATAVEHAGEAIEITDAEAKIQYVNPAFEAITGYTRSEASGKTPAELLRSPEHDTNFYQTIWNTISSGRIWRGCFTGKRKDGTLYHQAVTVSPVRTASGTITHYVAVKRDITEYKKTELSLKESEAQYRRLLETASEGIWILDAEHKTSFVNARMARMLGYTAAEMVGMSLHAFMDAESFAIADFLIDRRRQGIKEQHDFRFRRQDGSELWAIVSASPIFDQNGRYAGALGMVSDITERKRAEIALRESEERYRSVVTAMHEGIVLQDAQGRICACNASAERILGLTADQMMQRTSIDPGWRIIHEDGSPFPGENHPAMVTLQTGKPCLNVVMGVYKPSGVLTWILVNSEPLMRSNQIKPYAVVTSFSDITERKQAEEMLRKLSSAVEQTADNVIITNQAGIVEYVNSAFEQLTGYSRRDVIGKTPSFLQSGQHDQRFYQQLWATITSGNVFRAVFINRKKDGELFYEEKTITPIRDEQGKITHFVSTGKDITEQKQIEEKIKLSLQEKEVLLQEVHHRVKNNLQVISSLLNIQADSIEDQRLVSILKESQNRVQSMALIHEKLYRSEDLSNINFAHYIHRLVVNLFYSYNVDTRKIRLAIDADDLTISINTAIPCGLIINELVSNALKYAFTNQEQGELYISLHLEAGNFTLLVKDNGCSFPDNIDLYNTKSLGLRLVTMLVQQIKGTIQVFRDSGTAFEIVFPSVAKR